MGLPKTETITIEGLRERLEAATSAATKDNPKFAGKLAEPKAFPDINAVGYVLENNPLDGVSGPEISQFASALAPAFISDDAMPGLFIFPEWIIVGLIFPTWSLIGSSSDQ